MVSFLNQLPPLATLAPFEAAYRHRNFTKAADELHMSQASVSRRIRELEADLGISLFERNRHDVTPTEEADALVASVRLSLGELSASAHRLRRQVADRGTLTIFSDLSLGTVLVAPVVGEFQRLHPDLQIRVIASYEPIDVTAEAFDIGLQYGSGEASSYIVEPIAHDAAFPVSSPAVAALLPTPVTTTDLVAHPLLHLADIDPSWTNWRRFLTRVGFEGSMPEDGIVFTSYHVCLDVAERGDGIALGWEHSVKPRLDSGRLVRIPGLTVPRADLISAFRPNTIDPNPHTDEFLALLKTELRRRFPG